MKLKNDSAGQRCVAKLISISFLSGGIELNNMEKLKNPPFSTTFTRVRVIPGVTKRGEKMTHFSSRFLLPQQKILKSKRYGRKN